MSTSINRSSVCYIYASAVESVPQDMDTCFFPKEFSLRRTIKIVQGCNGTFAYKCVGSLEAGTKWDKWWSFVVTRDGSVWHFDFSGYRKTRENAIM
jgi:hypothetical protein